MEFPGLTNDVSGDRDPQAGGDHLGQWQPQDASSTTLDQGFPGANSRSSWWQPSSRQVLWLPPSHR